MFNKVSQIIASFIAATTPRALLGVDKPVRGREAKERAGRFHFGGHLVSRDYPTRFTGASKRFKHNKRNAAKLQRRRAMKASAR